MLKNIDEEQREFIREIDNVKVKGRARLITLYESFANDTAELIDKKLATLPDFLMGWTTTEQESWKTRVIIFLNARQKHQRILYP